MAFPESDVTPPHEVLQEEIVASTLGCFPPAAFQAAGPFKAILERRVPEQVAVKPQPKVSASTTKPATGNLISFLELRHRLPPRQG